MNSSSDSNGRKRRIVSGSASVQKTDSKPVSTNGPVGKKDAYQGRKAQFSGQKPNSSQQIRKDESGQFVTPQNTVPMPAAAQSAGEKAKSLPKVQPKDAPMKNEGTISPPLYPAMIERTVNRIFMRKPAGRSSPPMHALI